MDIGSILPLLAQRQNGGKTDMSAMISALTGQQSQSRAEESNPQSGLSGLSGLLGGGGGDPAALLSMLKGGNGGAPNLNLVNLLSTLGKQRTTKKLHGLKPVKSFIPDKILGKLVKYFQ